MTDTNNNDQWDGRELTPAQMRNREAAALIPMTRSGAMPTDWAQAVDYAKFMSTAIGFVGGHLLKNVGACLGIMEVANQFGLPAYAVARQSYLVNGRVAFMGQFFHTVIEDYAPLDKGPNGRKLQFKFDGEGPTLKITVSGTFKGASEPVIYESPMVKDIKVKNSPLWVNEPRRQLIYFGVRGWQTINWPEGLLHAISEDEAAALPPSDYARDITPVEPTAAAEGLRDRLRAQSLAHGEGPKDGFQGEVTDAHFTEVTENLAAAGDVDIDKAIAAASAAPSTSEGEVKVDAPAEPEVKPKRTKKPKAEDKTPAAMMPTTAAEWVTYARAWIDAEQDPDVMRKRWADELKLRNGLGVTSEDRDPVFERFHERLSQLEPGDE